MSAQTLVVFLLLGYAIGFAMLWRAVAAGVSVLDGLQAPLDRYERMTRKDRD